MLHGTVTASNNVKSAPQKHIFLSRRILNYVLVSSKWYGVKHGAFDNSLSEVDLSAFTHNTFSQ